MELIRSSYNDCSTNSPHQFVIRSVLSTASTQGYNPCLRYGNDSLTWVQFASSADIDTAMSMFGYLGHSVLMDNSSRLVEMLVR